MLCGILNFRRKLLALEAGHSPNAERPPRGWRFCVVLEGKAPNRLFLFYAISLRLMSPASPASPLPSSRKLDGSGVGSGEPSISKALSGKSSVTVKPVGMPLVPCAIFVVAGL